MTILCLKKKQAITLVLAVLSLTLMASSVAAQDTDMQEFVSAREFFSIQVPENWQTDEVVPGAALITANSDTALERYKAGDTLESGDFVVTIGFLPYNILQARQIASLDIQYEATPDVFLQSLLPIFRVSEDAIVGDVELVSVSDERDAGILSILADGREGTILVFHAADGVVAFVSTLSFPGERGDFQEIAHAIAAGTEFNVAQDALWGVMLGH